MKNFKRWADEFVEFKEWVTFTNSAGEEVLIWLSRTRADKGYKNDLMNIYLKNGWISEFIEERITLEVFATDKNGHTWGWYNPQHKLSEDGKRLVINFDYILADTPENREFLIDEVIKMAEGGKKVCLRG